MLQINGKNYDFRFSYRALKGFLIETGLKIEDTSDTNQMMLHLPSLIYHGVKAGCKASDIEFDLTIDAIEDWLDEDIGNAGKAFESFESSQKVAAGEK